MLKTGRGCPEGQQRMCLRTSIETMPCNPLPWSLTDFFNRHIHRLVRYFFMLSGNTVMSEPSLSYTMFRTSFIPGENQLLKKNV